MVYQPASRSYTPSGKVALLNHYPRPLCDAQDCHSLPKTIAAQPSLEDADELGYLKGIVSGASIPLRAPSRALPVASGGRRTHPTYSVPRHDSARPAVTLYS